MLGNMVLRIWDVEHGACAMLTHNLYGQDGRLAMIDSGHTAEWRPSTWLKYGLKRAKLDYLFITNPDQDHMSDLQGLWDEGIEVTTLIRNPSYTSAEIHAIKLLSGPVTNDAQRYVACCAAYNQPAPEPFDGYMGGITCSLFWNSYPTFINTNDLSLVVFIKYANFKILFPGDLGRVNTRLY